MSVLTIYQANNAPA